MTRFITVLATTIGCFTIYLGGLSLLVELGHRNSEATCLRDGGTPHRIQVTADLYNEDSGTYTRISCRNK